MAPLDAPINPHLRDNSRLFSCSVGRVVQVAGVQAVEKFNQIRWTSAKKALAYENSPPDQQKVVVFPAHGQDHRIVLLAVAQLLRLGFFGRGYSGSVPADGLLVFRLPSYAGFSWCARRRSISTTSQRVTGSPAHVPRPSAPSLPSPEQSSRSPMGCTSS